MVSLVDGIFAQCSSHFETIRQTSFLISVVTQGLAPQGRGGYLSTARGTGTCHFLGVLFSNHYGIMGIIFTIF